MKAIIRQAALYDYGIKLLTLGREGRFRDRLLAPVQLRPGESVLDVGCGTGTLALLARRRVGTDGMVAGVDPSHEMITRARAKAAKAGAPIHFDLASADALPYSEHHFDVVLCTVTLHHLPRWMRAAALNEMRRVLKTGGRLLLVDFVFGQRRSVAGYLHRHIGLKTGELNMLAAAAGFHVADHGAVGRWDLQYLVGHS